jgi:chromate transport protein ChrA
LRGNRLVLNMTRGLGATAVGLLLATTWNLAKDSMSAPVTWVVLAVGLALLLFTRLPTLVSLLAATGAGVVLVVGAGLVS